MHPAAAIVLLLLAASAPLQAQKADTLAAAHILAARELPVIRASEEVNLSQAVAVPQAVADVFRRFTGVQVKDYGGVGGLKTVNVRSLGSEHVGIFIDGIQVDNAQNMQVDLGRFSTDGLGTVSLYNGQKTRRLQTAREYTSGASVHLESERPVLPDGYGFRARLRGGSFGTVNPSFQWDQAAGPLMFSAGAEFLASNGRYKFPYFDEGLLVRENSDLMSARIDARCFAGLRNGELRLHLYGYGSERGFPGPVIRKGTGLPFSAERQADQDLSAQGSWIQDWNGHYATALRFKYANNYTHYNTHPEKNPAALPYDLHYRQQSVYGSFVQSYVPAWSHLALDLAADLQWNHLDADAGLTVTPQRLCFTGALAARLVWEKFRIAAHIGYLGAWDRFTRTQPGAWDKENAFRDAWMPSFSLFYAPVGWFELDAFVKRSFRLPSFNDLYYRTIGNSDLKPESALQCGIDLRFKAAAGPWKGELRLSPYYNRVEEKIVAIPTASQFRWTMLNIGKVDIGGLEARAEGSYSRGDWTLLSTLRYTFQRAVDHSEAGSATWDNQIPYIPLHSGAIDIALLWRKWTLSWNTVLTGGRWSRTANTDDYYIAPWSTTDVSIARAIRFRAPKGRSRTPELTLALDLNNIFNQYYQIVQGYPMPGFHVMASAQFHF